MTETADGDLMKERAINRASMKAFMAEASVLIYRKTNRRRTGVNGAYSGKLLLPVLQKGLSLIKSPRVYAEKNEEAPQHLCSAFTTVDALTVRCNMDRKEKTIAHAIARMIKTETAKAIESRAGTQATISPDIVFLMRPGVDERGAPVIEFELQFIIDVVS